MSWITAIWSATAAVCLTLAGVHFVVWVKSRDLWANLLFSIAAGLAAVSAGFELALMHAQTPAQFGELLRWFHVPVAVMVVSLIWFVRQYLQSGRLWLLWLFCGLRIVTLTLTFSLDPNLNFREITGLHSISAWGETIVSPIGVKNPWTNITHASGLVLLVFVVDAAIGAWRKGQRRRALVVGGTFGLAVLVAMTFSEMLNRGGAPIPFTLSLIFLIIIVGMAWELSVDLLNANRLARELSENQKRLRLATRAANLGVWEWDVSRDEIWITDTIRSRIGLGESERPGLEQFLQSLHPDDREETRMAVRQALEDGNEFQADYRSINSAGEVRWFAARGQVERSSYGRPLRLRGVSMDITERKATESALQRQRAELARVQRVATAGQLAAALAHELNQPLGAILRNAEAAELFLGQDPPDHEELRAILADIKRDDERAGAVIDRLRYLMARGEGKVETVSVRQLVEEVTALTQSETQSRQVVFTDEIPYELPPVRCDRVQIQQVLLNLVLNALDALEDTPAGRKRMVASARLADEKTIEVAMSDAGSGFSQGQEARLFEPFHTTKANGLGMGLAISRTIIESHGGRIWAEHNPEGGATFRFTLKVAGDLGE